MEINEFIETGAREGWLHKTDNVNRMRVDGREQNLPVYEVRIDRLRYNVQNGRISTFVSRYHAEHGELPQDVEKRNAIIEHMIEEDNPERLKTTRLDIKAKGQQEVAIILSDGTVIDSNRRFTCLRMLSRETSEPMYLRCYIFPDTYDAKAIKGLELEIQLGRDEKVNYDAISRLVDIHTWVNEGPMTSVEYGTHANISKSDMRKYLEQIDVLHDFLNFIDAPAAYHIAQDLKVQGPIEALAAALRKCKNEDDREDMKQAVFANIVMGTAGDMTRHTRTLCENIRSSQEGDGAYLDEQLELAEQVMDKIEELPSETPVTTELLRDRVTADDDLKIELKLSNEKAQLKAGTRKIKNVQVRNVRDALSSLESIDEGVLSKLSPEQLADMENGLQSVLSLAERLKTLVSQR